MNGRSIRLRCAAWTSLSFIVALPTAVYGQVVQNRTIEFPGGGTKNNNGFIGPFCCTGETAIIQDVNGKPVGYIYFYNFSGARILGVNRSAAPTVNILISSTLGQNIFPSASFSASNWTPGKAVVVEIDTLTYKVTIVPQLIVMNGQKLFDMGSLKAIVNVTSKPAAPAAKPSTEFSHMLAQFSDYRFGVAAWFQKNPGAMGLDKPISGSIRFNPGEEPYDVEPIQGDSGDSQLDSQLLGLARDTGMLRAQLRAARYPVALYEPQVEQYERESIRILLGETPSTGEDRLKILVSRIEQARQTSRPDLPALDYVLSSNLMNPISTIFRTSQPGGRVWIISQLRFEVCRAQFPNPYDRNKCRKWRETDPQNPMSLSGTYVYQVNWGGGNANGMRTVERSANAISPAIYQVP